MILNKDNHIVDHDAKVVWWRGSYPFVMTIGKLMQENYPDYDSRLVTRDEYAIVVEVLKTKGLA